MGPIPAKYFWPGFCIALLVFSVGSGVATVVASRSDGGAQIVGSYSVGARATAEERAQRRENRRLDWKIDLEAPERLTYGEPTGFSVRVRNASGRPLEQLDGRVELYSPARTGAVAEATLRPAGPPGLYRTELPIPRGGLWDFVVRVESGTRDFATRIRREL